MKLTMMSKNHDVNLLGGTATYDFTSSSGAAFGVNPQKELEPGVWGMFAGDVNADGKVQPLEDLGAYIGQTNIGATGYQTADFNLDTLVHALDFNLYVANWAASASSKVPGEP